MNTKAIGIFDSGIGGLTVMQQVMQALPHERIIYFGDTARVPYGEKSRETIVRYSFENTVFLLNKDIKALVVACNTASAFALETLKEKFSIPLIGVIEPGVKKAIEVSVNKRIAVLGTRGTVSSGIYQVEIQKHHPKAYVLPIACPLLVPLIEEHFITHPATRMILREYLKTIRENRIDTVLLGCTHYPLLGEMIQEELGEEVTVLNSASACADKLRIVLEEGKLQASSDAHQQHQFYVSDDPHKFQIIGKKFLGIPIENTRIWRT